MSGTLGDLQQRAVDLAKSNNFGAEALDLNLEIARVDAANQGAWTRLARCYLEQRRFADAAGALATVLELNPSNTIAKSLLNEVTKRRAMALPASEAATGFTAHDFDALGHLAPVEAARALAPKIELLLQSVNEQRTSVRIVEARNRAGQSGSKLFHRNSYHPGANGHIYAYHHGGRWEPQFDLGFFSATPWGANWMRIGLGFNLADSGRDDRAPGCREGRRRARTDPRVLRNVSAAGRRPPGAGTSSTGWGSPAGSSSTGARGPAVDLLPQQAVEWLINCRNPAGHGWVFVGRWLSLEKIDDARTLGEMRKVVATVEDTFAALFPLWVSVYGG